VGRPDDDNVIDFVFDPWISEGARHNYLPLRATALHFRVAIGTGQIPRGRSRDDGATGHHARELSMAGLQQKPRPHGRGFGVSAGAAY
jgi:hypothetical protein